MNTRSSSILTAFAVVLTASQAFAQYREVDSHRCDFGYSGATSSDYRPSGYHDQRLHPTSYTDRFQSDYTDRIRGRFQHEMSRFRDGYDYRAPLDSAVNDMFRRPVADELYKPRATDRDRLQDPFRLPSTDDFRHERRYRTAPLSRNLDDRGTQTRFRPPYSNVDYSNYDREYAPTRRGLDYRLRDPLPYESGNEYQGQSLEDSRIRPGVDPFTPPLPRREDGSEADAIFKAISSRYANPVNIRTVRGMSESQAMALYREVSQQTDQRHLEPSSYDLRVRRGIRNLSMALENPAFQQAFGLQSDSFRTDGFRTTLSRIADSMRVSNYNDAQQIVQSVMLESRNIGLSGSVVAFEFANATVDTLDKFSALEPKEPGRGAAIPVEETHRSASLEGEIVGVGVEIKDDAEGLMIMKALRGGPAAEAGLKSGDIITAINGRRLRGMPMSQSVDLMKGNAGSRIELTVVRNGSRGANVTLMRRRVRIYTVNDARMEPRTNGVAYISLSQFGQKSTQELDQALEQLYSKGMKSLILDMRGNPGGLLNVCVDITNRFLPCGTIVSTKGRLSSDNMHESATYNRTWSTPLVVLIDEESASASEIFAAAIQDNRRGIVVGQKSYGKGTVQTHFPLTTVNGNLRLTTARFYSPNGRAMSGEGVAPDVNISDSDGPANGDRVLQEAIQIAQSQRLKDIAQAAARCRPSATQQPLQRNTFKGEHYDGVVPKIVRL